MKQRLMKYNECNNTKNSVRVIDDSSMTSCSKTDEELLAQNVLFDWLYACCWTGTCSFFRLSVCLSVNWPASMYLSVLNPLWTDRSITGCRWLITLNGHCGIKFQPIFKPKVTLDNQQDCFVFVITTKSGRTAAVQSLPTHGFCDRSKTAAAVLPAVLPRQLKNG